MCLILALSVRLILGAWAPFTPQAFKFVGTEVTWVGEGVEEYGHVKGDPENVVVRVDPRYFRPTEVDLLLVSGIPDAQLPCCMVGVWWGRGGSRSLMLMGRRIEIVLTLK